MLKSNSLKLVGIECYHAYQSFVEGEVTPAQAHEIGVKLAEEIRLCGVIQRRMDNIKRMEVHRLLEEENSLDVQKKKKKSRDR